MMNHLVKRIFESNVNNFEDLSLEVFQFQFKSNVIYRKYCQLIGLNDEKQVKNIHEIPFLPINLFKSHEVRSFDSVQQKIFYSSSTFGLGESRHFIKDLDIYKASYSKSFSKTFGSVKDTCILGLLPSYLERENSSLIYMVNGLMAESSHPLNSFFLYEHEKLLERLNHLEKQGNPYFLFGVSFALLDFALKNPIQLKHAVIIETGGMKGRKKEMLRAELLNQLFNSFKTKHIFSEYGMTELLSQAYANFEGGYACPPWMKIYISEPNDPFNYVKSGKSGLINVIDLANLYSCAFIQTSDLGKQLDDTHFEVLGRLDNSDLRGCSLMVQ